MQEGGGGLGDGTFGVAPAVVMPLGPDGSLCKCIGAQARKCSALAALLKFQWGKLGTPGMQGMRHMGGDAGGALVRAPTMLAGAGAGAPVPAGMHASRRPRRRWCGLLPWR